MTHSCVANVELASAVVGERPGLVAKATRDIETGEELSVSLVDAGSSKRKRQELLRRSVRTCVCVYVSMFV